MHKHVRQSTEKFNERNKRLLEYWINKKIIKRNLEFLDFGSGEGHISDAFNNSGITSFIHCLDAEISYKNIIKDKGYIFYNSLDEIKGKKFDFILLMEVIHHIENPIQVLKKLKALLSESGTIFLTFPVGDTSKSNKNRIGEGYFNMPYSRHFFTEKSFRLATKKAGFTKCRYKYLRCLHYGDVSFFGGLKIEFIANLRYLFGKTNHLTLYIK
jgi:SAM-dependent methyltransferase